MERSWQISRCRTPSRTMSRARPAKWETPTLLPLPTTLPLLPTQGGPVRPPELQLSLLPRVSFPGDRLGLELRGSSLGVRDRSPLVPEHRDNTQDLHQCLVASRQVLVGSHQDLDNIHPDREPQDSSPPAQEHLGSSRGSTHLRGLRDSSLEPLCHTHLDHFTLALELLLALTPVCLSQEEGMECMGLVAPPPFPQQPVQVPSQDSLVAPFPRSHLDHGVHMEEEDSLLPLGPSVQDQDPWTHMVGLLLQEEC